jgi:hypothetical protein
MSEAIVAHGDRFAALLQAGSRSFCDGSNGCP